MVTTPLSPSYFFEQEGIGACLGLVLMRSLSQDALERGVTPTLFYAFDREGSEASLSLVPNEVTVPGCFGTNRKVYKCHPRPITFLYILGCILSTDICFGNRRDHGKSKLLGIVQCTGHFKYQFLRDILV